MQIHKFKLTSENSQQTSTPKFIQHVFFLLCQCKPFQGHGARVDSVTFSPDGKRIVSGSLDNTARVWDVSTGVLISKPFKGHEASVSSVVFSSDGKRIVSGSDDKTVRMWDISWEKTLQVACQQLRYHPSLTKPKTDVAKEAKQTCEKYAWK